MDIYIINGQNVQVAGQKDLEWNSISSKSIEV